MEIITSLKNPRVLVWKSLKDRKGRKESGCFVAEGRKMTEEALASAFEVEAVLLDTSADIDPAVYASCPENRIFGMPSHVFAAVCDTRTPQGIAAVVRIPEERIPAGKHLVAMDGVQDPGNVGTILRTADAAGFDGVILSRQCADPYSPKVLRSTMGSIFHLPFTVTDDLPGDLTVLREKGYSILSSQLDGTPFFERENTGRQFCLIIGSEGNGVSSAVSDVATHRLKLPMYGEAESLNAAIAAGIMMYDLIRFTEE